MFDRIMENSMAIWLLVSAAYPIFLIGMIVKAVRHYRRLRSLPSYGPIPRERRPQEQPDDWIPAR